MDHAELGGNFITKTVKHSRTQHEMFMKLKQNYVEISNRDAYNYNIYLIVTGLPDLATHL